jgi:uncharacterized protein YbjQ (UPF0145 family)
MERLLSALALVTALCGCYLPRHALLDDSFFMHRKLVERPFEELGLVHAEVWGATFYWTQSSADLQKAVGVALMAEASRHGADAVVDIDVRVENHYSGVISLFIFGWEECHATGTAIRYTDGKK